MSVSKLLKRIADGKQSLVPSGVAVPDMPHLFEPGEPNLLYVARLSADTKEEFEVAYDHFRQVQNLGESSVKHYRAFAIAFCLCDAENNRAATDEKKLHDAALAISTTFPNNIVARIFRVADNLNAFFKVDEATEKKSLEALANAKSEDGNGESLSTSDTQADEPG